MKISELKNGEQIKARWLLKTCEVRKTNTKPPRAYLQTSFTDGTDEIRGNMWNYVDVGDLPPIGKAHNITAQVSEYMGTPQLTITRIDLADNQDMSDFLPDLGYDKDALWNYALELIAIIQDEVLLAITKDLYLLHEKQLKMAPAAKSVHHAGLGGLLKHSIETCEISYAIAKAYAGLDLNLDLIIAGSMLHDIGKLYVYEYNDCLIDMTDMGYLIEHIPMGIAMLDNYKNDKTASKVLLLQHIIASHHGKLEYGSSVTPKFAEAYIINRADGMSATLDMLKLANKKARQNDRYTSKIFALDNYPHMLQDIVSDMMQ